MDIRCGSCNKLFRIADEKVTGKAVRFKCSRCGEIITVTRDMLSSAASEPNTSPTPAPPIPIATSSSPRPVTPPAAAPSPPPVQEPAPSLQVPEENQQDDQAPAPSAGLSDFDFREPYDAAQNSDLSAGDTSGDAFSFDSAGEQEQGGELTISEEEAKAAETGLQFPADIISEPARKSAFSSSSETGSAEQEETTEKHSVLKDSLFPDTSREATGGGTGSSTVLGEAEPSEGSIATSHSSLDEEEIDLGRALAVPAFESAGKQPSGSDTGEPGSSRGERLKAKQGASRTEKSRTRVQEPVHPLASGTATGAVAGIGCGIPAALLLLFGFSMLVKMVPLVSGFPVIHLAAVIGTGIFTLGVLTGVVIALIQAQAGRKLFFLVNVLVAALFGALYGAGMDAVTGLVTGKVPPLQAVLSGAVSGGVLALLLGVVIVLSRWIFFGKRSEVFGSSISGLQKTAIFLSLIVMLGSLYAEGTLLGRMERSAQEIRKSLEVVATPEGLTISDAQAYVDPATGDLVITGRVNNGLAVQKSSWYLEVQVFDQHQNVLATLRTLNGVQLFEKRDIDILAKRGKDVRKAKAGMILALQQKGIPAKGSTNFEMRLMDPPQGMASFYPTLKKYDLGKDQGASPGTL